MLRNSYSALAGLAALLVVLALGCGLATQPPATSTAPEVVATRSAEAWLANNSSLLVSKIATELERTHHGSDYDPEAIKQFWEQIKAAGAEEQLGKSTEWEVGIAQAGGGHYEVMVVGSGEIVLEDTNHRKTLLKVESTALLVVNGVTQVVDQYQIDGVAFSSSLVYQ